MRKKHNTNRSFWRRVEVRSFDECWEWVGARCSQEPYGYLTRKGRHLKAHRYVWELAYGEIPTGLVVRHACDNPPCVNLNHLSLGTPADNVRDKVERGRMPFKILTDEQVAELRLRYVGRQYKRAGHWHSNATHLADEFGITRNYVMSIVAGRDRAA